MESFHLTDQKPAWPLGQSHLEKWPSPEWTKKGFLSTACSYESSWQPHSGRARAYRYPGFWREKSKISRHLRASRETEGYQENPYFRESRTAPQLDYPPLLGNTCHSDSWAVVFKDLLF